MKTTPARMNARDKDCTLSFPGCKNDTSTVVLCHLRMFNGGGMGYKPHDSEAVFACHDCHAKLDGREQVKNMYLSELWEAIAWALVKTLRIQREDGILKFKGEK